MFDYQALALKFTLTLAVLAQEGKTKLLGRFSKKSDQLSVKCRPHKSCRNQLIQKPADLIHHESA